MLGELITYLIKRTGKRDQERKTSGNQDVATDNVLLLTAHLPERPDSPSFNILLDLRRYTDRDIASAIRGNSMYEVFSSRVAIQILRSGDFAVDIGAHAGYYTLLFRTLVGATGLVYSFEPMYESFCRLVGNIQLNGYRNVHAFPVCLAARDGLLPFVIDAGNEGESHLSGDGDQANGHGQSQLVPAFSLDTIFEGGYKSPRLLKIDAEGAEYLILEGGREWISQARPDAVICEINRSALERGGTSEFAIRQYFEQLGYATWLINLASEGEFNLCEGKTIRLMRPDEYIQTRAVFNLLFTQPCIDCGLIE